MKPKAKKLSGDGNEQTVSKATLKLRLLKRLKCTLKYEKLAWDCGAKLVAGVDEVGRGSKTYSPGGTHIGMRTTEQLEPYGLKPYGIRTIPLALNALTAAFRCSPTGPWIILS